MIFRSEARKSRYFEKNNSLTVKMMTSHYGKWVGSKFCHPRFSSILAPKKLIETKKLLLPRIVKQDIFLNIRACTKKFLVHDFPLKDAEGNTSGPLNRGVLFVKKDGNLLDVLILEHCLEKKELITEAFSLIKSMHGIFYCLEMFLILTKMLLNLN